MGRIAFLSTILRCAGAILAIGASTAMAQDASLLTAYFDQLRDRRLFSVAERYGQDRRAELPKESADSVQLAVELSRTFAAHAFQTSNPEEQAFLQSRAEEVLDEYRPGDPFPRIDVVALERAYREIDHAELARWSWTGDPDDLGARDDAVTRLTRARASLAAWIDSAAESAARPQSSRQPGDLTRRELASLIHTARLKSVDLLLTSADLTDKPNERERFVRLAEDILKRLSGSAERGTTQAIRGFNIRIARLMNDEGQLKALVRQTRGERTPLAARQAAIAEQARYELDQGRFEAAATTLTESKSSLEEISDQLRALHVEAVLGMARSAGDERPKFLAAAEAGLANISGPWHLRIEYLLQQFRQAEAYGADSAELVRRGNREFRRGNRDRATDLFREAAVAATVPAGRAELRFMTASLLVEAERFREAIAECEHVANDAPSEMLAARASLLTAYCRGRISAETRSPEDRQAYQQTLQQHLQRFPDDSTAGDAAWMLSTLAAQSGQLAAVVEAHRRMPADHPRSAESLNRAADAVQGALEQMRASGKQDFDGRPLAEWSRDASQLAARLLETAGTDIHAARRTFNAARLLSTIPNPRYDEVLALLNRIPQPVGVAEAAEWESLAHEVAALRLVCFTAAGKYADATAVLEQLRSVSIGELLDVLRKMNAAGSRLQGERRKELARLELATIHRIRLQAETLPADQRQMLAECEAEALFASGQFAEAARMFQAALSARPELAPRLAESLEQSGGPDDLSRALKIWRDEEAKHQQGSAPWFEARLRVARLLLALGQEADFKKLMVPMRLLYPEMGGALKPAFDELERQAAAKKAS